jgi:hypothetical protein
MRCVLRLMLRVRWAPPIVLVLAIAPDVAFAQSPVCHAVRRGESATQVARRVTGDGRNAYEDWFQIKNASSRSVPKSQYNRIRAGWQVCVTKPVVLPAPERASAVSAADRRDADADVAPPPATGELDGPTALTTAEPAQVARDADFTLVWLGTAMVVPWFGWRILDDYLTRRTTASIVVRHFARRFIVEFERPLVRDNGEPALRSRFRRGRRRGRFDILLKPGKGRRYPNLSDHKQNVEYDVARVMRALSDKAFVSGPLYTYAGWVVVPFQFTADSNQRSGVTCISSF